LTATERPQPLLKQSFRRLLSGYYRLPSLTRRSHWRTARLLDNRISPSGMDAEMTKLFQATKSQKILIAGSTAFVLPFSATALWLWQIGNMPIYFGLISVVVLLLLIGRFVAITRSPVVEVHGNHLNILGWFGGKKQFDLSAPIEMASTGGGIVLKQGKAAAGLGRYVIGKNQFDEVVQILEESTGKTVR
jgi:hypothetical protein